MILEALCGLSDSWFTTAGSARITMRPKSCYSRSTLEAICNTGWEIASKFYHCQFFQKSQNLHVHALGARIGMFLLIKSWNMPLQVSYDKIEVHMYVVGWANNKINYWFILGSWIGGGSRSVSSYCHNSRCVCYFVSILSPILLWRQLRPRMSVLFHVETPKSQFLKVSLTYLNLCSLFEARASV